MTTNYHTPIGIGATNAPSTLNTPLGTLDSAITSLQYANSVFTAINNVAGETGTVWTVDDTTGFLAGASITYALNDGTIKTNTIATVDSSTQLTVTVSESGTLSDNAIVAQVAPGLAGIITQGFINVKAPAYGALGDGSNDDTAEIQAAVDAASAGDTIFFPPTASYYKISDEITISKALTIIGYSSKITQTGAGKAAFNVTASNVVVRDLEIVGTGAPTAHVSGAYAIFAHGADKNNYINNIKVLNCRINTWAYCAVALTYVNKFEVAHNTLESLTYAGVQLISCQYGHVHHNYVYDIKCSTTASNNGYGIIATCSQIAAEPRSQYVIIDNNIVNTVATWEGIDTHGGNYITISNNQVYNCYYGIVCTHVPTANYSPKNIIISSNLVESTVTDGTKSHGIILSTGTTAERASGKIIDNYVRGHGLKNSSQSVYNPECGILIYYTSGVLVDGNTVVNCSSVGIAAGYQNIAFSITNNIVVDPWSGTLNPIGIYASDDAGAGSNTGLIDGNSIATDPAFSATKTIGTDGTALVVTNGSNTEISLGNIRSQAATFMTDSGKKVTQINNVVVAEPTAGDVTTTNTATYDDVTGYSVTIIPRGGKILLSFSGVALNNIDATIVYFRLQEGATVLKSTYVHATGADYAMNVNFSTLITSPTIASHTYKLTFSVSAGTGKVLRNATFSGTLIAQEI
jgi:hypothetical protein